MAERESDGIEFHMAIFGSGHRVAAACRLDEIEILVDYLITVDNRLCDTCVIVVEEPPNDEESLLLARCATLLERAGYGVKAVTGDLEYSFVIVDEQLFTIYMLVRVTVNESKSAIRDASAVLDSLIPRPEVGVGLYTDEELFPEESESEEEFSERLIESEAKAIQPYSEELLRQISANPEWMFKMHPRDFEELVAKLLERMGFQVELTPVTRDGGRDILAKLKNDLVSSLYLVECKRYAPQRPVGIDRIRSLYGVVTAERATAGIVVTTSHFSPDAVTFAEAVRYQMALKDYQDLQQWLRKTT